MFYELESATRNNIDLLIQYKLKSIINYADNLSNEEIDKINNYVKINVPKQLNDYKIIKDKNEIIGCLLIQKHLDGILLDEIYIEENYRNKGIGTDIIKTILASNDIVYLWVYKNNIKAFNFYEKLGFLIINETDTRHFMCKRS